MASCKPIRQVGVIPYYEEDGEFFTVVVTARGNPEFWLFPKGHIESGETIQFSANMEAYEEAGLIGRVDKKSIGSYQYEKAGKSFKVGYYPFKVKKTLVAWPESAVRRRIKTMFAAVGDYIRDEQMLQLADKTYELLKKKGAR